MIIDLDAKPLVPDGWTIAKHRKGGLLELTKTKIDLFLTIRQKRTKVDWANHYKEIADQPLLNANALDFFLANPNLVPEEWKGTYVFFWGTIYRDRYVDQCVRYLCWGEDKPSWNYLWRSSGYVAADCPAACVGANLHTFDADEIVC